MTKFIRGKEGYLVPIALASLSAFYMILSISWYLESRATEQYQDMSSPAMAIMASVGLAAIVRFKSWLIYEVVGILAIVALAIRIIYIVQVTSGGLIGASKWIGVSRSAFLVACALLISRMWNTDIRQWMEDDGT